MWCYLFTAAGLLVAACLFNVAKRGKDKRTAGKAGEYAGMVLGACMCLPFFFCPLREALINLAVAVVGIVIIGVWLFACFEKHSDNNITSLKKKVKRLKKSL